MSQPPSNNLYILRGPEVSRITGFRSKSHVENLERQGFFPRSVKIGPRAKGWVHSEILEWVEARIVASREGCRVVV